MGARRENPLESAAEQDARASAHVLSALGSGWPSFAIVATFLLLVGTLVVTTLSNVEERIVERTEEQLTALARGIRGAHALWAEGRRGDVRALAASPTLMDALERLAVAPGDPAAKASLRRRLEAHVSAFDFPSGASMLSRDGEPMMTVGSRTEHARGFAAAFPSSFDRASRGLPEVLLIRADAGARQSITNVEAIAAAPVIDADGVTLGVVVWEFDPSAGLSEIATLGRVGRTSRAFAFDDDGRVLVAYGTARGMADEESRGRVALIARTLEGEPGTISAEYPDAAGRTVMGASLWAEDLDLGIGVELSRKETFEVYYELRNVVVGSLVTMAALSLALLGVLGTARARVVRGLESSRARLERLVQERTSALADLNRELRIEAEQRMRHAWELETAREALEVANRKLEIIASKDVLTGLANRRAFEIALEREWQRATRTRTPIGLLMTDVDDFKTLNDTQGHPAGDDALRRIGATLRAGGFARRPGDLVCRVGGEEFAILLEDATLDHVEEVAEEVRKAILDERIEHPGTHVEGLDAVSVSVGAASIVPRSGEDPDLLVALADKALYRAKNEGRNRVVSTTLEEHGDLRTRPPRTRGGGFAPEA